MEEGCASKRLSAFHGVFDAGDEACLGFLFFGCVTLCTLEHMHSGMVNKLAATTASLEHVILQASDQVDC